MNHSERSLVVKLGSELFKNENGDVNREVFSLVAAQTAALCRHGVAITVVSSFAIRLGELWLAEHGFECELNNPALAGIGQPKLMAHWGEAYLRERLPVSQVLVSDASLMHRDEWENTGNTIALYHRKQVIPIVNANDPVSWNESARYAAKTSDNDFVTAQLVPHIAATDVLFLTKVAGVYDARPEASGARRYREINFSSPPRVDSYSGADSNGGMKPKIENAIACFASGSRRVAITGLTSDVILRFMRGEDVPTMIGMRNIFCD